MAYDQKPVICSEALDFQELLYTACERLSEKHIEYSLRRILELDEELLRLEKELDNFINNHE